jgi:hypothetical protein
MLEKYKLPNNRGEVIVLNDGWNYRLGTKERVTGPFVQKKIQDHGPDIEFVYSSSSETAGGYALARAAMLHGAKAALFLVGPRLPPHAWGLSQLVYVEVMNMSMADMDAKANQYVASNPKRLKVPFGIHDQEYRNMLFQNLQRDPEVLSLNGRRIWIAVGSGTLLSVLLEVLPRSTFQAVQVGKSLPVELLTNTRVTAYEAPEKFPRPAEYPPPYRSLLQNYDAKIWRFVLQHGQDGDAIWVVV